ncbi:hypothetical protein Tco_0403630 [Tanacetum coccineum]
MSWKNKKQRKEKIAREVYQASGPEPYHYNGPPAQHSSRKSPVPYWAARRKQAGRDKSIRGPADIRGRELAVNEETDRGKYGVAADISNDTGRNKEHKECEHGNTSGILVEEVLVDDCKAMGNSGLEEEQCKVQSDTQMPPLSVNSKKMEGGCFYDVMVAEGSKKWELTLCGYFVGYKIIVNELRYNLRRMWGRYGFKDIMDYNNGGNGKVGYARVLSEVSAKKELATMIKNPHRSAPCLPLGRNKGHKECEQGNTSGILVEEVLVDDCKAVGNSGLEEEQCKVQSDTQMPPQLGRNKEHKECQQGNTSGILFEEVLVDDCKAVGNSGLEEE